MFINDQYLFNQYFDPTYQWEMEDYYFLKTNPHFADADTLWVLLIGA